MWPGLEADNSHLSSAKDKNAWNFTPASPYVFMALYLVKLRYDYNFALLILK
jgi:hypothetical protein